SGGRYLAERAIESYWRYYQIHWPIEEHEAGRGGRRSPLYQTLAAKGAVFGSRFGWERANWFAPEGTERMDRPSFEGRPNWFAAVGKEARAMRTAVGLCDMSSFTKLEIAGKDAAGALQTIAANDVMKPPGSLVYTQILNQRGGIEADLTITRLAEDRFYVVTGSAFGVRDRSTIERNLPAGSTISITDLTSARSVIALMGPNARALLAEVSDADLSNEAFPYLSARHIPVGYATALALRVSYVGELGYELHIPAECALDVYERIAAAGLKHGMRDVGYRAIDSLRLEKRYLYWGADITPDYTPLEAGLGFAVAFGKGEFVGREALERQRAEGIGQRLCTFLVDDQVALYGGEAIWRAGRVVGVTTSAGYGHSIGRSIAFGYLAVGDAGFDDYELESFGTRVPARRSAKAPYDPDGKRLRS
ncbi:MAG: sarcosine dehydrogenase, partial [Hyphomicrobiaceae bacterium]